MDNSVNLGLFAVHKIVSEYEERIYAYIEKTPRDTKLCRSQLRIIQNLKILRFFLSALYEMNLAWKPSHATVPSKPNSQEKAQNFEIHVLQSALELFSTHI
jgi:hypothetical protein